MSELVFLSLLLNEVKDNFVDVPVFLCSKLSIKNHEKVPGEAKELRENQTQEMQGRYLPRKKSRLRFMLVSAFSDDT